MEQLFIGTETEQTLVLGPGTDPVFKYVDYLPGSGPGEQVTDRLDLGLETEEDPGRLAAAGGALEAWLERSRGWEAGRLARPVWMWAVPWRTEPAWRSPVRGGWLEALPGAAGRGIVRLRVHLERSNYWEGPEAQVPLANSLVPPMLGELSVTNHHDAGLAHDNYVQIAGEDVLGSLPAPIRLRLINLSAEPLGEVRVGALQHDHQGGLFEHTWEGEDALGGVPQTDSACSGGKRQVIAWDGPDETDLLTWPVQAEALARAGAGAYRAVLRLAPAPVYPDLWLRFKIQVGATAVWEGPWTPVQPGAQLVEGGSLPLPPYPPGLGIYGAVDLVLSGRREGGEPASLSVDCLTLLPLDGWRRLVSAGAGLLQHRTLVDDGVREAVYIESGEEHLGDFMGYGEPLRLAPGRPQRLVFVQSGLDGSAPIDRVLNVSVFYRPRRRVL